MPITVRKRGNTRAPATSRRRSSPPTWKEDPLRVVRAVFRGNERFREAAPVWNEEQGFVPAFDIRETRDAYIFTADVPGVKEEDLEVTLSEDRITVRGTRFAPGEDADERSYASERAFGCFSRTFTVPQNVDHDDVRGALASGVLTITLPKRTSAARSDEPESKRRKATPGKA